MALSLAKYAWLNCIAFFVLRLGREDAKFKISLYKLRELEFSSLQATPADPLDKMESETSSAGSNPRPVVVTTALRSC